MPLYKITETHICCDTYINIEAKDEKEARELIYSGDYTPYETVHEDNVGFEFEIQKEVLWDNLSIVRVPKLWYQYQMNRKDIEDLYGDDEPNILFADGFDAAISGVIWDGERTRVVYEMESILEILTVRDSMTYEEAVEFFDYNIAGSHMGDYTPFYLET